MLSDGQRIGVGLCLLGLSLGFVGVLCFLDRALLTLGNLAFMSGIGLVLGGRKTLKFFVLKPQKWKASLIYILGVLLIALGYSLIGLPLQMYGLLRLFASFLPQVLGAVRLSPIGCWVLQLPGLKQCTKWVLDGDKQLPL